MGLYAIFVDLWPGQPPQNVEMKKEENSNPGWSAVDHATPGSRRIPTIQLSEKETFVSLKPDYQSRGRTRKLQLHVVYGPSAPMLLKSGKSIKLKIYNFLDF